MSNVTSDEYAQVADVVARYADFCDHGRWDDAAALFAEDGVFDAEAIFGEIVSGRADLSRFMGSRPAAIAHHPTSFYVDRSSTGDLDVRMKMLVIFDGAISSIDYYWTMASVDGSLQIARQEIAMIGRLKTKAPAAAVAG
jgi:hypothetical protein